jgi:hypothetical protein
MLCLLSFLSFFSCSLSPFCDVLPVLVFITALGCPKTPSPME